MERLILDTSVLVDLERGAASSSSIVPAEADLAIAAITASELLVGVALAEGEVAERRNRLVEAVLAGFEVLPLDLATARHHAALLVHARRSGRPRGAHDLIIAAAARASGRAILTTDTRGFDDLPGVVLRGIR